VGCRGVLHLESVPDGAVPPVELGFVWIDLLRGQKAEVPMELFENSSAAAPRIRAVATTRDPTGEPVRRSHVYPLVQAPGI
jgi:hypothetical protein